jgi:hypothetical protein
MEKDYLHFGNKVILFYQLLVKELKEIHLKGLILILIQKNN